MEKFVTVNMDDFHLRKNKKQSAAYYEITNYKNKNPDWYFDEDFNKFQLLNIVKKKYGNIAWGDIVSFFPSDSNEGKFVFDGDFLQPFDFDHYDFGVLPKNITITENLLNPNYWNLFGGYINIEPVYYSKILKGGKQVSYNTFDGSTVKLFTNTINIKGNKTYTFVFYDIEEEGNTNMKMLKEKFLDQTASFTFKNTFINKDFDENTIFIV